MRRLVSLTLLTLAFVVHAPDSRADAASDLAEKVMQVMERAATVADMNKTNCDAMGDKLTKLFDDNAAMFQQAKDQDAKLTDAQRAALSQRYATRSQAAMRKLTPAVLGCRGNPKVASVIARAQSF